MGSPSSTQTTIISGTSNRDVLTGNWSNDVLIGNGSNDVLIGGAGKDTFIINDFGGGKSTDYTTIQNFDWNQDSIVLQGVRSEYTMTGQGNTFLLSRNGTEIATLQSAATVTAMPFDLNNSALHYFG